MKRLAFFIPALAASLMLTACGKDPQPVAVEAAPAAQSLLAHVPSDTPYLAANLQPIPEDVLDANFARMQPVLDEMQIQLGRLKSDMASGMEPGGESVTGDVAADRLLLALLDEFDGKLSRDGMMSLGWDLQSTSVIYGDGAFPVVRIGLSDPATLRATILRILANAEIEVSELEFGGVAYWRIVAEDQSEVPAAFYVSILPDHLAAAIYPLAQEADFLPSFLGLDAPAESAAAERLAALSGEYGFTPYGAAYLDLHRLADEFMDPASRTAVALNAAGVYDSEIFTPQCVAEAHRIIDNMPMVAAGVTELDVTAMQYRLVASVPSPLAERLVGLVAAVPGARALADRLAEMSFGIKVGAVRDFVREKAQTVVDEPFQCEQLTEMNAQAQELLARLEQPMPPFVNNFRGFRLSLKELVFEPGQDFPKDVRGHVALHVEQPQMFVGMAQMFLPDLSEMELAPGDEPSRVPEFLISYQGIEAWAAMSDDAIGLSVGAGEQETLVDFLEMEAGPDGAFLSLDYDYAAAYEYRSRGMAAMGAEQPAGAATAISNAMVDVMKETGDRNRVEMKVTEQGLVIDSRMTFKQ
jgi:hypothetical protein